MDKTITFNEKQIELIQLALEVFINTIDGKNDNFQMANGIRKILQEYSKEAFASVHSQGG